MQRTAIVNLKHHPDAVRNGAVRIDRRTKWGNWRRIREGRVSLEELAALHGKTLACHCAPLPCHGEVLARAAWAASVLAARRAA